MTNSVRKEIEAAEAENVTMGEEMVRSIDNFAKYIMNEQDSIRYQIAHPYVPTKKDIRRKKRGEFVNKLKKVLGL